MPSQPLADRRLVRVLIVDDQEDAIWPLKLLLERHGHQACTALDGASALREAEVFRPEVVLLDIGLPEMNGFETASRIRQRPWGRDVALIALTGWGKQQAQRIASATDFDGWVLKPVEFRELTYLIDDLLSMRMR